MSANPCFEWRSCGLTSVGTVRQNNEDSFLTMPEQRLWVVADGMGGHAKGEKASKMTVEAYESFEPRRTLSQSIEDLENRALKVNAALREDIADNPRNMMGTTLAMMYGSKNHAYFLWAGDSRIYRYRNQHLEQITHDHSFVQESVDKGTMSPEEALNHPSGNIITRAIGVHDKLFIDIDYCSVKIGDKYLLCSDGLFKDVTLNDIAKKLNEIPYKAAEGLIKLALSNGANDNVTVIVVECSPLENI